MNHACCGSAPVTEPPDVTARSYRRFRHRVYGRQFNERSGGMLNRICLPRDIIAFVVFCRLRYRLTLRDLSEILALIEPVAATPIRTQSSGRKTLAPERW